MTRGRSWGPARIGVQVLLVGLLAVVAARLSIGLFGQGLADHGWKVTYNGLIAVAGLVCAFGGRTRAWWAVGAGLILWAAANTYWTFALITLEEPPYPSVADLLFLLAYVPLFAGVWLLLRGSGLPFSPGIVLDALIGGLGAAAVVTAYVLPRVVGEVGGGTLGAIVNLLYPLADVALIGLGIAVTGLYRQRIPRAWLYLVAGFVLFGASDTTYLIQVAEGRYREGTLVDLGWPAAAVLIALAALQPARALRRRLQPSSWEIAVPVLFALTGLAVLLWDHYRPVPLVSLMLACGCVIAVVGRMIVGALASARLLAATTVEARTDSLTGLGNRRALVDALDPAVVTAASSPMLLGLFDLNGFKQYNDTFGHPAGDALLQRLGGKLAAHLGESGSAFRMGGDEFCVLVPAPAPGADAEDAVAAVADALSETGEGFVVSAAHGHTVLPAEAATVADALRLADQRMYANKTHGRLSAGEQSTHVLLTALHQRNETLGDHVNGVAELAADVARVLGLSPVEIEETRTAAKLHDIGKVAIPDAILAKPGPLDEHEWSFMRRHTIIGETIMQAAPSLAGAARLVRASHERYDGTGYPDRRAGSDIPLGARIIFVCDAFDAIISDRPYAPARTTEETLAELDRHSGTQFDPQVVSALKRVLEGRRTIPALGTPRDRVAGVRGRQTAGEPTP